DLEVGTRRRCVGRASPAGHDRPRQVQVLLNVGDVAVVLRTLDRRVGNARRSRRIRVRSAAVAWHCSLLFARSYSVCACPRVHTAAAQLMLFELPRELFDRLRIACEQRPGDGDALCFALTATDRIQRTHRTATRTWKIAGGNVSQDA